MTESQEDRTRRKGESVELERRSLEALADLRGAVERAPISEPRRASPESSEQAGKRTSDEAEIERELHPDR